MTVAGALGAEVEQPHRFETIGNAASRISVSTAMIHKLLREGELTRYKVRRRTLIDSDELDELIVKTGGAGVTR